MTLSIAMCTYNSARYVSEQLESFVLQTRPPDELIISDDRSTDHSVEIAAAFAKRATFPVRLCVNDTRLGTVANFDKAISLCSGDLIVLSDADNYSRPHHLATLEGAFDASDVGMAFSDAEMVDSSLKPTGERYWQALGLDAAQLTVIQGPLGADALLPGWFVQGACMAFRSIFRKIVLPIPADLPIIHDGWIAAVIAGVTRVKAVEEPLVQFRLHPEQEVGAPRKQETPSRTALVAGLRRSNSIERERLIAERVRERLMSQSTFVVRPGVADRLADRIAHVRTRAALSGHVFGRVVPVTLELLSGRYHRYANGALSAAKDFVKGTVS